MANIGLVHEWLTTYAGSERVVEQIAHAMPISRMYVLVDFLKQHRPEVFDGIPISTSYLQKIPFARRKYRGFLPLMPIAVEQHDVTEHDLVIASQHCVSHGVITRPDQPLISYVHSPMRYAWDLQHEYLRNKGIQWGIRSIIARKILHYTRLWDRAAADRVDHFVCNSKFIAQRIAKFYRRESTVIHPPVATDDFKLNERKEDFYLTAGRMVPYKKFELVVRAFAKMPDKKLVVIGDGPEMKKVKSGATPNVTFEGHQPFPALCQRMGQAKGFVFAALEDFGIMPVEAQACGTPVIAYGRGGSVETVADGRTGVLFSDQTEQSIVQAIERFESLSFAPEVCREHSLQFSEQTFRDKFSAYVDRVLSSR
ncbi:MAG: glycosyltransferase [Planctomycetales bacterium]|nr:glycosyltransferase [Planctomycetales bacterium]